MNEFSNDRPIANLLLASEVKSIALDECVSTRHIWNGIKSGSIIILKTKSGKHVGVGKGLTTKVNANVGTSSECNDYKEVLKKAHAAVKAGAHTLMELSSVGIDGKADFAGCIAAVVEETGIPVGTVPVYEATRRGMERAGDSSINLDTEEMLEVVARQAEHGASFMAIHVGLNKKSLEIWRTQPRNIVSKGGYLTAEYMLRTGKENPYFERFDDLIRILKKYNVVLNIGSALRSGSTRFNDAAQQAELKVGAELAEIASSAGVQVVIEGPGHVPYGMIGEIVKTQQSLCNKRPFFVLGFVPTDCFSGRDHIVSAIGATEAVRHGASWLCYVTPAEHHRMPTVHDVKEGVIAARMAAHIGDCAKKQPKALALEFEFNDKGCLDSNAKKQYCSMCGQDFCPIRRSNTIRREFVF